MRKKLLIFICCIFLSLAVVNAAAARHTLSFQGYITDKNGQPVFGTRQMRFAVCSANTGAQLFYFPERQVTVYNGNYSAKLVFTDAELAQVSLLKDVWLEVVINGAPMIPRIQLLAAPLAGNVRGIEINELNEITAITFNCTVTNKGYVSGGTLRATTINNAVITGGSFNNGKTMTGTTAVFTEAVNVSGKIQENNNDLLPAGSIIIWPTTTPPAGWSYYRSFGTMHYIRKNF